MRFYLPAVFSFLCPLSIRAAISLDVLGTYKTGIFDESAAEIVAHDPCTQLMFVSNGSKGQIDVIDIQDPEDPDLVNALVVPTGYSPTSVTVVPEAGVIATSAANNTVSTDPGIVAFFTYEVVNHQLVFSLMGTIEVGAGPDMLTVSPDYNYIVVANEGEPEDNGDTTSTDPDGSVSIIDISEGIEMAIAYPATYVKTATFTFLNGFEDALRAEGIRITKLNNKTASQDIEPEYVAITPDSQFAYVTLQENNAVAKIELDTGLVWAVYSLGLQDHSEVALDASDRDGISLESNGKGFSLRTIPGLFGMRMADSIAAFEADDGKVYFATANEGDARDWDEEKRIKNVMLDATAFPKGSTIKLDSVAGRLEVSTIDGDTDGDLDLDQLFSYGGRSFSIYDAEGNLVFDSGSDFEIYSYMDNPEGFNSDNGENDSFDSRSDAKGPEPEGLTVGEVDGRIYCFIGLERVGGIMIYDVTEPAEAFFIDYINNRDFDGIASAGLAGDLGIEGITFVPEDESPIDSPLLLVANEVSGSTTIYKIVSDGKGGADKKKKSKNKKRRIAALENKKQSFGERRNAQETERDHQARALGKKKGKGKDGKLSCRKF